MIDVSFVGTSWAASIVIMSGTPREQRYTGNGSDPSTALAQLAQILACRVESLEKEKLAEPPSTLAVLRTMTVQGVAHE